VKKKKGRSLSMRKRKGIEETVKIMGMGRKRRLRERVDRRMRINKI
jgi:hypothetical protein